MKGKTNPPIAESICKGTPYFLQTAATSSTLSTIPCGYCAAEQTTTTVLDDIFD
jgi:hypothetical protein